MQNSPLQLPTEPDCLLQGLARRCKSILPVQWTANIEQSHYCFHFYVSLSLAHHYNEHCHLFSSIEVDCVKVHVVRGSGESQTGGRVEKLSGKGWAIIVTVLPPGNRKHGVKTLIVQSKTEKCPKKVTTKFWRRIQCQNIGARCLRHSRTLLGRQSCNRPERKCNWLPPRCPRIW